MMERVNLKEDFYGTYDSEEKFSFNVAYSRPWVLVGSMTVFLGLSQEKLNNVPLRCSKVVKKSAPTRLQVEDADGHQYSLPVAKVVYVERPCLTLGRVSPQDKDDQYRLMSLMREECARGFEEMGLDPYTIELLKCKPLTAERQLFDCHGVVKRAAAKRGDGWTSVPGYNVFTSCPAGSCVSDEFHAVLRGPEGKLHDVARDNEELRHKLFVPDPRPITTEDLDHVRAARFGALVRTCFQGARSPWNNLAPKCFHPRLTCARCAELHVQIRRQHAANGAMSITRTALASMLDALKGSSNGGRGHVENPNQIANISIHSCNYCQVADTNLDKCPCGRVSYCCTFCRTADDQGAGHKCSSTTP